MREKLRIGILGTGNIARQFCQGALRSDRCHVAGVGSRSPQAAAEFAGRFGIPAAYGSYDELLADQQIQAVYISAPNALHHPWTLKALRARKHVLCEKPFALNTAQCQEMFDVADRAGVRVMEAFMYLCHPQTAAVLQEIRRGTIGAVRLVRSAFTYSTRKIAGNVRFDRALGGGGLMDVGCYCISLARLIAGGEPVEVRATAQMHETGVDHLAAGMLRFGDGMLSTFACGMLVHGDNTAHISGDAGWIEVPWPWKPAPDRSGYVIAGNTPPLQDQPAGKAPAPPPRQAVKVPVDRDLFCIEADAFAAAVQEGTPLPVSREFTLGNMRVLDEIRRQIGLNF